MKRTEQQNARRIPMTKRASAGDGPSPSPAPIIPYVSASFAGVLAKLKPQ